ncbi:MAG: GTP-binding protein [Thermoplasmata archaeon]|nr:GTP-binding protein [Thermoplasmata archaeon]
MSVIKRNIVLVGDASVGKTSLVRRFVTDNFSDKYITTIGLKVTKKEVDIGPDDDKTHMVLMIWDIIGQKGYKHTQSLSFKGVNGALLVMDLTREETLDSLLGYWIPLILKTVGPVPLIFLGNKADLKDEAQFGLEEIRSVAQKSESFGSTNECFLTSAKTGENVEEAFIRMAELTKERHSSPMFNPSNDIMQKDDIFTITDVVDNIIADFSEQFGGIENATPIVKFQLNAAGLILDKPNEISVIKFVENLAHIESSFKTEVEVKKNRNNRLQLFGYKHENAYKDEDGGNNPG